MNKLSEMHTTSLTSELVKDIVVLSLQKTRTLSVDSRLEITKYIGFYYPFENIERDISVWQGDL